MMLSKLQMIAQAHIEGEMIATSSWFTVGDAVAAGILVCKKATIAVVVG